MNLKSVLPLLLLGGLISCATRPEIPPAPPSDEASIKLTESADAISRSLSELARVQAAATPPVTGHQLPNPETFGIHTTASVDWSGPIGPLMNRLARASHYRLRILGHAPAVPIIVTVSAKDAPLGNLIRDVDFQAGDKAQISVFPKQHIIELRYAKL